MNERCVGGGLDFDEAKRLIDFAFFHFGFKPSDMLDGLKQTSTDTANGQMAMWIRDEFDRHWNQGRHSNTGENQ